MLSRQAITQTLRATAPRASMAPRFAAIRNYAAPSNTKPPIEQFGLDGTYASALYQAAAKTSALDATATALASILKVFQRDPKLQQIMLAPTLTPKDKSAIIAELQKAAGGGPDKDGIMKNFLATLSENNRLGVLEGVCERFAELMSAHRGEVELRVTSAAPLDQKVLKQLEAAVSKSAYVGQGKKLKVVPKVQPDIRGGLVVEIGDRTIDLSVSSKMARMNKLLQDTL